MELSISKKLLYSIVGVLLLVVSCQSQEAIPVPYELIHEDEGADEIDGSAFYNSLKPDFLIITSLEEAENPALDIKFPPTVMSKLRTIDYSQDCVVALFYGRKGDIPAWDLIKDVQMLYDGDDTINIIVNYTDPEGELGGMAAMSSPYEVLKIAKAQQSARDITFNVYFQAKVTEPSEEHQTVYIP